MLTQKPFDFFERVSFVGHEKLVNKWYNVIEHNETSPPHVLTYSSSFVDYHVTVDMRKNIIVSKNMRCPITRPHAGYMVQFHTGVS